ncbi:tRNA (cytidine(34)-2'-O)-methyltransferase [Maribacter confluentis]|uniref:Putative tRNA (cytidine(34)-2'-O)-methyltransferase n=1 Tax=Maribacter confluentis TaxID=1656093 RepID=A0ABT8RM45_9FLAO|nr:tRNA (cytidine(34)-2'-O)-methyltransferase [Maribacter confluentis]MDO1511990.1 tRNA (cytidine(34)-2'-O)-methyltransferase [Maribacter confluentis]
MSFNIVLIEPEIPNNTGNIGRLALGTGSTLHLVKPFGFEINDKRLKRAGLDYWQHLNVIIYENQQEFFEHNKDKKMIFFSASATKYHWEIDYYDDMFLIFGKESVGLPKPLLQQHTEDTVKIPLYSDHIRSLNLANAVAISIYEGLRQLGH